VKKLVKFVAVGIPSFALAIPLNYALVTWSQFPKPLAYAVVLLLQVTVNFFLCRAFVFDLAPGLSLGRSFIAFLSGIALFRVADWGVYVLLTSFFGVYFLVAQLLNGALFVVLKFQFSKLVFERRGSTAADSDSRAGLPPASIASHPDSAARKTSFPPSVQ
jgi:putative flippase GtrA